MMRSRKVIQSCLLLIWNFILLASAANNAIDPSQLCDRKTTIIFSQQNQQEFITGLINNDQTDFRFKFCLNRRSKFNVGSKFFDISVEGEDREAYRPRFQIRSTNISAHFEKLGNFKFPVKGSRHPWHWIWSKLIPGPFRRWGAAKPKSVECDNFSNRILVDCYVAHIDLMDNALPTGFSNISIKKYQHKIGEFEAYLPHAYDFKKGTLSADELSERYDDMPGLPDNRVILTAERSESVEAPLPAPLIPRQSVKLQRSNSSSSNDKKEIPEIIKQADILRTYTSYKANPTDCALSIRETFEEIYHDHPISFHVQGLIKNVDHTVLPKSRLLLSLIVSSKYGDFNKDARLEISPNADLSVEMGIFKGSYYYDHFHQQIKVQGRITMPKELTVKNNKKIRPGKHISVDFKFTLGFKDGEHNSVICSKTDEQSYDLRNLRDTELKTVRVHPLANRLVDVDRLESMAGEFKFTLPFIIIQISKPGLSHFKLPERKLEVCLKVKGKSESFCAIERFVKLDYYSSNDFVYEAVVKLNANGLKKYHGKNIKFSVLSENGETILESEYLQANTEALPTSDVYNDLIYGRI